MDYSAEHHLRPMTGPATIAASSVFLRRENRAQSSREASLTFMLETVCIPWQSNNPLSPPVPPSLRLPGWGKKNDVFQSDSMTWVKSPKYKTCVFFIAPLFHQMEIFSETSIKFILTYFKIRLLICAFPYGSRANTRQTARYTHAVFW